MGAKIKKLGLFRPQPLLFWLPLRVGYTRFFGSHFKVGYTRFFWLPLKVGYTCFLCHYHYTPFRPICQHILRMKPKLFFGFREARRRLYFSHLSPPPYSSSMRRKFFVFSLCGLPNTASGEPSSSITPSAM